MTNDPSVPSNPDIGGSLAEHVRRYQTDDPAEAALRDQLAGAAQGFVEHELPGSLAVPAPAGASSPAPSEETVWETWNDVPEDTERIGCKGGGAGEYNGGLWTVRYPDGRKQQFGHGFFVHSQAPFRPAPPQDV